jgi:hypothetical protein
MTAGGMTDIHIEVRIYTGIQIHRYTGVGTHTYLLLVDRSRAS